MIIYYSLFFLKNWNLRKSQLEQILEHKTFYFLVNRTEFQDF